MSCRLDAINPRYSSVELLFLDRFAAMTDEPLAIKESKMIYCTYCRQSFSRYEHLERHILTRGLQSDPQKARAIAEALTDTNVKPFQCDICYRSYTRRYVY